MIATIEYATQKFGVYNRLIFNNELPVLPFLPSKARTYMGRYECDIRYTVGSPKRYNHRIRINTVIDLTEEEIDDVLIHEMIHYYISFKGLRDTSTHGQIFRQMMADINARYGRHITISMRRTKAMDNADTRFRQHYICVMTLPDGRRAFTPVTEQSMFRLWTFLPEAFKATEFAWFYSFEPFFNAYRRVSAARGPMPRLRTYPIDSQKLEEIIATALRLKYDGKTIMPE